MHCYEVIVRTHPRFILQLRIMGTTHTGPACVHGDDQSMLAKNTTPGSTLKKKSSSLAYHLTREGVAIDDWMTAHANTIENEADILAKVLYFGEKRRKFVMKALIHAYGSSQMVQC